MKGVRPPHRITLDLTEPQYEQLREASHKERCTKASIIRAALDLGVVYTQVGYEKAREETAARRKRAS